MSEKKSYQAWTISDEFGKQSKELDRHVNFRAVFRAATAQFVAKRGISSADMSAKYLIPKDQLPTLVALW